MKTSFIHENVSMPWFVLVMGWIAWISVYPSAAGTDTWDLYSDTWTATDALGRTLPDHTITGPPRPDKQVGIFYFLWLGRHGERGPFDITRILQKHPAARNDPDHPSWGPLHAPHHWGESVFGYYVSDDDFVLRKHAQMLPDAGVDVVIFDVSNQLTYPESWRALGRVFSEVRQHGQATPQFAFLCPFWTPSDVVRELYRELYRPGHYRELWYHWRGHPLILADPDKLGHPLAQNEHNHPARLQPGHTLEQSFHADLPFVSVSIPIPTWKTTNSAVTLTLNRVNPTEEVVLRQRFTNLQDNGWLRLQAEGALESGEYQIQLSRPQGLVGWWSHTEDRYPQGTAYADSLPDSGDRAFRVQFQNAEDDEILRFFTFRKPQPDYFSGPTGPEQWGWLEVYPQHVFYEKEGLPEQMTVGVAQNAVDGKLSVLSNPRAHGRSFHDGRQPKPADQDYQGYNFAEQWHRALEVDPPFLFITGWNEWIAGRFSQPSGFYGDGPVTFVDQFSREYSRDIEPMRGGHEDSFLYQMAGWIRRYKGARSLPPVSRKTIQIDGRFEDWDVVQPEYRDTMDDQARRDYRGWGADQHYRNETGHRDLVTAKVCADQDNLYFLLRLRTSSSAHPLPSGLRLFIDADANPTNGWMGYDIVINRLPLSSQKLRLEKHGEEGYSWGNAAEIPFDHNDNSLELAVPRSAFPPNTQLRRLDFKWSDHILESGEWSDFTLHGDVAPNDRYNYRAILIP